MPVYLIVGCETAVFSFLISSYMHSFVLGLVILGGSSLIMYALFQHFYSPLPFIWGVTLLGSLTTLLWTSYLDIWLGTSFIAIFLSLFSGVLFYFLKSRFFKKYHV